MNSDGTLQQKSEELIFIEGRFEYFDNMSNVTKAVIRKYLFSFALMRNFEINLECFKIIKLE